MGRLPRRGRLIRARSLGPGVLLVVACLVAGCGAAEQAGQRLEQEAQERVDAAVDRAVEGAAERVEQEIEQQLGEGVVAQDEAQDLLRRGLDELEASGATCAAYAAQGEADRRGQMGALLRAFWLAEMETTAPSSDATGAFTADVDARCASAPDASVASVAREAYASGAFSPAAG